MSFLFDKSLKKHILNWIHTMKHELVFEIDVELDG